MYVLYTNENVDILGDPKYQSLPYCRLHHYNEFYFYVEWMWEKQDILGQVEMAYTYIVIEFMGHIHMLVLNDTGQKLGIFVWYVCL